MSEHNAHWVPDELDTMKYGRARVVKQHWECSCTKVGSSITDFMDHLPEGYDGPRRVMDYMSWMAKQSPVLPSTHPRHMHFARPRAKEPDVQEVSWGAQTLGTITGLLIASETMSFVQSEPAEGWVVIKDARGKNWILTIEPTEDDEYISQGPTKESNDDH